MVEKQLYIIAGLIKREVELQSLTPMRLSVLTQYVAEMNLGNMDMHNLQLQ